MGQANCGKHGWCDGHLTIHGPDHISFHWSIWKTVEYRLVSAKASEAKDEGGNIEAGTLSKLCASSATIKAAVVSAEMFIAMAKPASAAAALKLVEMGVEVSDNVITALSSGAEAIDLEGIVAADASEEGGGAMSVVPVRGSGVM